MKGNRYLAIEGQAGNWAEAITLCGNALYDAGLVSEDFANKCRIREKDYPTGLPTDIPVAIPHCKDDGIKQNSICYLKLESPVEFKRMDDDRESVMTDIVFNLAIKDAEEHLEALQKLMQFVGNAEALKTCKSLAGDRLIAYLKENIGW